MAPEEHIKKMELLASEAKRKRENPEEADDQQTTSSQRGLSKKQLKKLAKKAKKGKIPRVEPNSLEKCADGCPNYAVSKTMI